MPVEKGKATDWNTERRLGALFAGPNHAIGLSLVWLGYGPSLFPANASDCENAAAMYSVLVLCMYYREVPGCLASASHPSCR